MVNLDTPPHTDRITQANECLSDKRCRIKSYEIEDAIGCVLARIKKAMRLIIFES